MTDLQTKWLEALRSGVYSQNREYLRNRDKFCCLGVLCDISDHDSWTGNEWKNSFSFPSDALIKEVGITAEEALYLSEFNDVGGSFSEIADLLELKFKECRPIKYVLMRKIRTKNVDV